MRGKLIRTAAILAVAACVWVGAEPLDNGKLYVMCPNYAADYWELFQDDAPWQQVMSRLDVFKTYIGRVDARDWDTEGPVMMSFINRHGMEFLVEAGGLRAHSGCDGAEQARRELLKHDKFVSAGGTLDYIVMDGPFRNSIEGFPNPKGLDLTIEEAAAEIVEYMQAIHAAYPNVKIGMNEPIPWYWWESYPEHMGRSAPDLKECIDALLDACGAGGEKLWFFHADSPFEYSESPPAGFDGWAKLAAIQDYVQSRGLWFGLYHNSSEGGSNSDKLFFERTLLGLERLIAAGGDPDHFIVQSWYPHPSACMPESPSPLPQNEGDVYPFVYLVKEFMQASGAALRTYESALVVKNGANETVAWLDDEGNLVLAGTLMESAAPRGTGEGELLVRDGEGTVVAAVYGNGDMALMGAVHEEESALVAPAGSVVFKNGAGEIVGYVSGAGDLYLTGTVRVGP